jgi:hypothetical protein
MTTYKLIGFDDDGNTLIRVPMDIGTLDAVLVFQFADGFVYTQAESERVKAQLQETFPDRRVLVLSPGIRFVRFVPVDEPGVR